MWLHLLALCPCAALLAVFGVSAQDAPMPDPHELKQRALASMKRSEKELEKYSCVAHEQVDELNADGSVKRHRSKQEEQFFVNGVEINHALAQDGNELSGEAARKEQQRVDQEVRKYSDVRQARRVRAKDEKQVDMFLRAVRFSNGRREQRAGRSTVAYNLAADTSFQPKKLEERFAQALVGSIWLDEQSGNVAELRVETDRDVKIGGGLLANIHKGFQLHLVQERQPDGVWLTNAMDGSGDARAGLLLHPRFRFKRRLDKCHLFSVDAKQTPRGLSSPAPAPAKQ
jgi:hypothetical protein